MPELPEVETIKNTLLPLIKETTIRDIEILNDKTIIGDSKEFINSLKGQTFIDISRIGKFLIFHLSNDLIIISHLRMEGKYFFYDSKDEVGKHAKVIFYLSNNKLFVYDDMRSFGFLKLSNKDIYLKDKLISDIAKEPKDIDPNELYIKSRNSNIAIKTFLLDQKNIAGLGNIYTDETLYASGVHPLTKAKYLTLKEFEDIVRNATEILETAIRLGGSTIKSYHPSQGVDGRFQTVINVYDKKDTTCKKCGHLIRKIKVNGRGSSFCPHCQKYVSSAYNLAVYGPVGSGKSTVLNLFKECGQNIYDCDKIVDNLYQKEEVINHINKMFNFDFKGHIDKAILREYLITHKGSQSKLEKYIHPLVKQQVKQILNKNKKTNNVVEVPLLYKAKMEDLFDFIILVKSDKQLELLNKRNSVSADDLIKINKNNVIKEDDADFIIYNNKDINDLKNQVIVILNKLNCSLDQKL